MSSGNDFPSSPVTSPKPRVVTARPVPHPPRSSPTLRCPLGALEKSNPKKGPTGANPPLVIKLAGTGPNPKLAVPGGRVDQSTLIVKGKGSVGECGRTVYRDVLDDGLVNSHSNRSGQSPALEVKQCVCDVCSSGKYW